jgi:hypothetical protein
MKFNGRGRLAARAALVAACVWWGSSAWAAAGGGQQQERVSPAGEVVVVLSEQLLSSVVEAIAAQPVPPTYKLSRGGEAGGGCADVVSLLPETQGARTAVRFVDGRITAPVAFRGAYEPPLVGCVNFEGWADTTIELEFDPARQTLNARLRVREINLRNVPSFAGTGLAGLVQDAIDERVNPVEILRAEQLGARLPAARGSLRLRAREVRHEVAGKELRLRIVYEIVSSGQ